MKFFQDSSFTTLHPPIELREPILGWDKFSPELKKTTEEYFVLKKEDQGTHDDKNPR